MSTYSIVPWSHQLFTTYRPQFVNEISGDTVLDVISHRKIPIQTIKNPLHLVVMVELSPNAVVVHDILGLQEWFSRSGSFKEPTSNINLDPKILQDMKTRLCKKPPLFFYSEPLLFGIVKFNSGLLSRAINIEEAADFEDGNWVVLIYRNYCLRSRYYIFSKCDPRLVKIQNPTLRAHLSYNTFYPFTFLIQKTYIYIQNRRMEIFISKNLEESLFDKLKWWIVDPQGIRSLYIHSSKPVYGKLLGYILTKVLSWTRKALLVHIGNLVFLEKLDLCGVENPHLKIVMDISRPILLPPRLRKLFILADSEPTMRQKKWIEKLACRPHLVRLF